MSKQQIRLLKFLMSLPIVSSEPASPSDSLSRMDGTDE